MSVENNVSSGYRDILASLALLLNAIPRLNLRDLALPPTTLTCTRASDQMNGATGVVANEILTNEQALPDTCDRLG